MSGHDACSSVECPVFRTSGLITNRSSATGRWTSQTCGRGHVVIASLLHLQTNVDLQQGIDDIGYSYGFTATGEAMKVVRENMFVESNGNRKKVSDSNFPPFTAPHFFST